MKFIQLHHPNEFPLCLSKFFFYTINIEFCMFFKNGILCVCSPCSTSRWILLIEQTTTSKRKARGNSIKNKGHFGIIARIKTNFISVQHYFFCFSVIYCGIKYVDIEKNIWN